MGIVNITPDSFSDGGHFLAREQAIAWFDIDAVGASFSGLKSNSTLVLAGVAMVSLATAIQTFVLQRNTEVVREVSDDPPSAREPRLLAVLLLVVAAGCLLGAAWLLLG